MKLAAVPAQLTKLTDNRRSTQKIIDLLNRLNTQVQQQVGGEVGKRSENHPIVFLPETTIKDLCGHFKVKAGTLGFNEEHQHLILARENEQVDAIAREVKCGRLSNDLAPSHGILSEVLRFISGILGYSQREICEQKGFSRLFWRKTGFTYLEKLRQCSAPQLEDAIRLAEEITGITTVTNTDYKPDMYASFIKLLSGACGTAKSNIACSTIHKAKGLEADVVLVIANSQKELQKWLEADKAKRYADKKDDCRIGFVAFGRAKLLLAIGCLKPIDDTVKKQIETMGIEIAPFYPKQETTT